MDTMDTTFSASDSAPTKEVTTSQMDVDEESMNLCKKRPREEEIGDAFQKKTAQEEKMTSAILPTVSCDDDFVSSLFEEEVSAPAQQPSTFMTGAPPAFSRMPTFQMPEQQLENHSFAEAPAPFDFGMKHPPATFQPEENHTFAANEPMFKTEAPTAFDFGMKQPPAVEMKATLDDSTFANAPTADLKMPALKATVEQPCDMHGLKSAEEPYAAPATQAPFLPSLNDVATASQPPQKTSLFVERWTCDVCKACSFGELF